MTKPLQPRSSEPPKGPGEGGEGLAVAEEEIVSVEPPKLYRVVMLNDDFTPMEFVIEVLQEYFKHDIEAATQIMLKIHHEGRGVCGVYTRDIAATKVELVLAAARRAGHPLQCILETA
ncbi:MAG: ATP-dependent Clp protease adapter ClpS [Burkholderiales bacterium]|nr:ATP-dependent Clp protease adapter ClpS [Burkholderiales bacterium]